MRLVAILALTLVLGGCMFVHKIDVQQGNYVTQETAAKLKQGMTKAEVKQLLGTPLLTDVFHANRWEYYFSNVKGRKAEDRSRLTIVFKDDKVVEWSGNARVEAPRQAGAAPAK